MVSVYVGSVKVWDPRQKDTPVACMEAAEGEMKRDCWAVSFGNSQDTERCVCAGYDNGDVKLFDLRAMSQRWETNLKNGVSIIIIIIGVKPHTRDLAVKKKNRLLLI